MADLISRDLDQVMGTQDRLRAAARSHVAEHGCNYGDGCTVRVLMMAAVRELEYTCSELARALARSERTAIERERLEQVERERYERFMKELKEHFEATRTGGEVVERFQMRAPGRDREQYEQILGDLDRNSSTPALGAP